jgi:ABC-type transport system involved in multi-copper enzyme maturation permease subunit
MAIAPNIPRTSMKHGGPRETPLRHLMRAAWIQAIRRNEIWIVAILLGLYLVGALILRVVGMDSGQTARFVRGLGLELGSMLSALLVIVLGALQIPTEIEQRTLYPVLAKPVTRDQVLLGKALPTWIIGVGTMLIFLAVTLAATPRQPYQEATVLAQAIVLKALGLAMLTALVFWLSLWMPPSLAMLVAGATAFLGGMAIHWIASSPVGPLAGLLPDVKLFEQFSRYVDGGAPLTSGMLALLVIDGALWTAIPWALATRLFRRRQL